MNNVFTSLPRQFSGPVKAFRWQPSKDAASDMETSNSRRRFLILFAVLHILCSSGCSIRQMAANSVGDMLAEGGSGTTFTGESDPELVRDALPFTMKLHELLLEKSPDHSGLLLATGRLFIMYAHAFVKEEAEYLPDEEIDAKLDMLKRAEGLYLRGQEYVGRAIEIRHPGFGEEMDAGRYTEALSAVTMEDVPYLYWCGVGWMGAYSATGFDLSLMPLRTKALPLLEKVLELDESFEAGAVHEFFLAYYGALPVAMGGSQEKARLHFERALALSNGNRIGPYISFARSVSVANQDAGEFRRLMGIALEFDPDVSPENRLVNIIAQRRARWLLDHMDNFIIE
jgi:predicted anti-sigma-YlaC factor YlaD